MKIKKVNGRKYSEEENSTTDVLILTEQWVDEEGVPRAKGRWERSNSEVNLGSMKNPNKKIAQVKLVNPLEKRNQGDIGEFFRGFLGK